MYDESLLGGDFKKRGRFDNSCLIPTIVACILGVLFVGSVVGIVILATQTPEDDESSQILPFEFDEYTATSVSLVVDTYGMHPVFGQKSLYYAYGSQGGSVEILDRNGNATIRQYTTDNSSTVACQMLGNHASCFRLTSSFSMKFSTEGMKLIAKDQPCSSIAPNLVNLLPNRKLDKCDCYSGSTENYPELLTDMTYQVVVESDTGYPVIEMAKIFQQAYAKAVLFETFNPGKPSSDEHLKPFAGTTVYDYRDHEGDCDEEKTFTTSENPNSDMIMKQLQKQTALRQVLHMPYGVYISSFNPSQVGRSVVRDAKDIPSEFDARTQWDKCAGVIGHIMNQNPCQCCWAMSSSAVLADRMCIAHNTTDILSPQYMIYCGTETYGCEFETTLIPVWDQLVEQGTVSDDCVPFTARNGVCPAVCRDGTPISDDMKVHASGYIFPWDSDPQKRVQAIQSEIMEHGSVQANFQVFSDMMAYQSGVYHRTKAAVRVGGHAVRIIGWGTESGADYWLVANSWDTTWGDGGFFKIRRGNNECNIEDIVVAAVVN